MHSTHPTSGSSRWTPASLHKDHLGSVRAISGPDGTPEERTLYRPYGAQSEVVTATLSDDKSWLGERYDAGAGLQYLNARYYDPELALFLQPDWFEVMQPGVGTNRYSYSFGDPVNFSDPAGNFVPLVLAGEACLSGGCQALFAAALGLLGVDIIDNGVVDGSPGDELAGLIEDIVSTPNRGPEGPGVTTGGHEDDVPGTSTEGYTPHGDPTGNSVITYIETGPQIGIYESRGDNNPKPVKEAWGPHSTWSVDEKGNIKTHVEWERNDHIRRVGMTVNGEI